MPRSAKTWAVLAFFVISNLAIAESSHCASDEMTVFNCQAGKKIVSVCASKDIAPAKGYLQYRFGRKNAPTLTLPSSRRAPSNEVTANVLTFAGGGGAYIRFLNGEYAYIVYTAIGRGWGEKAGIVVEKNHKRLLRLRCKMPVSSELGSDFFALAGIKTDQTEFDLP